MSAPDRSLPAAPPQPVYDAEELERFMQTYSYAVGFGQAGDVAAGKRLLLDNLDELRRHPDATPSSLLELWEIGLTRYEDQFGPERVRH